MKKNCLTLVLAVMAFVGASAQVGEYNGTVTFSANPTSNAVIEESGTFYTLTLMDLNIAAASFGNVVIGDVEITGVSISDNVLSGGEEKSISATLPPALTAMNGGVSEITVRASLTSGKIEENVLTFTVKIADIPFIQQINVTFEGSLVTGIYDVAANNATATAYYSITGKKLNAEPESGIFIVKYSDGKSVKVVK